MRLAPAAVLSAVLPAVAVAGPAGAGDAVAFAPGRAEVVLAEGAPGAAAFAACEATNFLSRVLGSAVPVVRRPTGGGVASLVLGSNEWCAAAGVLPDPSVRDAFRIRVAGGRVFVVGNDDDVDVFGLMRRGAHRSCFRSGTLFGVYEFLERFAGVRFYFPGEMGTVVPRARRVVAKGDLSVRPDFEVRDCFVSSAGMWPDDVDGAGRPVKVPWRDADALRLVYRLRLRECSERPSCCHGQNGFRIAERFSDTHPEYFMLRKDGTRCVGTEFEHGWMGRQLCHTSPVWDVIREETLERIRRGAKSVDVMPQDGMQPCQCPTCQARFSTTNFSLSSGYATELIWSNTVAVARAITAAGLDGSVAQMAYGTYRGLPSMDIPENVNLVLAVGGPWSESRPDIRDRQVEFVRSWAGKLGRKVSWIWTYPMKNYGRLQAPGVPQSAPHAYLSFYGRVAPYIKGTFAETDCGRGRPLHLLHNYLNFYAFSKFAWDHSFDLDAALKEHDRLMFGAGAGEMAKFFARVEELWIGKVAIPSVIGETEIGPVAYEGPTELDLWTKIYTPKVIAELGGYLDRAERLAGRGTLSARRVAWIRAGFLGTMVEASSEFMKDVLVETELARRAASGRANLAEGARPYLPKGCSIDDGEGVGSGGAIRIAADGNTYLAIPLTGRLRPNARYRLSYFVKTDSLRSDKSWGGACAEYEEYLPKYSATRMPGARGLQGTHGWITQTGRFATGPSVEDPRCQSRLWLRVFSAKGTVWFDGVRIEEE